MHDLLISGGTLIDPAQKIHEKMDVAIDNQKIQDIAPRISGSAKKKIDAADLLVTPGLVDIHTHTASGLVRLSVDPTKSCLLKGSTTVVDAGSTGELLFEPFRKFVIEKSKTRVFAFLNVESLGMVEFTDSPTHTDQGWSDLLTLDEEKYVSLFINERSTISAIRNNKEYAVGVKWAHHGIKGLALARKVCDEAGCRLMMENHFMPEALKFARKGDVVTHLFHYNRRGDDNTYDGLTDEHGKIKIEFFDAIRRGVTLDLGHGKHSFSWKIAEAGIREGVYPTTISTDLWSGNLDGPVYDLPTTISKLLHLGMQIENAIRASTSSAAEAIGKQNDIGSLEPGRSADVAIFKLRQGKFPLYDCYGEGRTSEHLLSPTHVVKNGEIVS